jgi:hypothetical protein
MTVPPTSAAAAATGMEIDSSSAPTSVKEEVGGAAATAAVAPSAASASASSAAAASQSSPVPVWRAQGDLCLIGKILRECGTRATANAGNRIALGDMLDWASMTAAMQQQGFGECANVDVCIQRTQQLLEEARTLIGAAPIPAGAASSAAAWSVTEVQSLLTALQQRRATDRLAMLQAHLAMAAVKRAAVEAGCAEAQAALAAQQAQQASHAAAAHAASVAAKEAAAAAAHANQVAQEQSVVIAASQVPLAASTSQTAGGASMSVALQSMPPNLAPPSRQSSLLSPNPASAVAAATAAESAASSALPSALRPSPLLLSPTSGGIAPGGINWPNSALHTPLKPPSIITLGSNRQSTQQSGVATAGAASPSPMLQLNRQDSVRTPSASISASPFTPGPSPLPLQMAGLPPARLQELYTLIVDTLTARPEAEAFLVPVTEDEAEGYYNVIKNPMAFSGIRTSLEKGEIRHPAMLWEKLQQIYQNCYTYNDKKTVFFKYGRTLETMTSELFKTHFSMYMGPWKDVVGRKGQAAR